MWQYDRFFKQIRENIDHFDLYVKEFLRVNCLTSKQELKEGHEFYDGNVYYAFKNTNTNTGAAGGGSSGPKKSIQERGKQALIESQAANAEWDLD